LYVFSFVDILIPDPSTPSVIDGGVMFLTGPCFSMEIERITCLFIDQEGDVTFFVDHQGVVTQKVIRGITRDERAICPMPLFRRLGIHRIIVTSNGTNFTGNFEVGMYFSK